MPWAALAAMALAALAFRVGVLEVLASRDFSYGSESAFRFRYAEMLMLGEELPALDPVAQWPEGFERERMLLSLPDRISAARHPGGESDTYATARSTIALFSGLAAAAFALLALAVLRRPWPAAAATLVYAGLFGAWSRSLNNYLREDFALPGLLLATAAVVHLLLGPAGKRLRAAAMLGSVGGVLWASSCWHMSQFYVALLGLLVLAFGLLGRVDRAAVSAGALWLGLMLAAALNPALWHKGAAWNVGSALTAAPPLALLLSRLSPRRDRERPILVGTAGVLVAASLVLGSSADYGHVGALVLAKLVHLGRYPGPEPLSPDARLFWVGPFESPDVLELYVQYGFVLLPGSLGLVLMVRDALREHSQRWILVTSCLLGFGLLYVLMGRMTVFAAPWAAIACVYPASRASRPSLRLGAGLLAAGAIGVNTYGGLHHFDVSGRYHRTVERLLARQSPILWNYGSERAQLLRWLALAPQGALVTDFAFSAVLLYATGRPVALHPMFEVAAMRSKTLEYAGTMLRDEQALLELCRRWDLRYVIHHAPQVLGRGTGSYYAMTAQEPGPGSVAYAMQFAPQELQHFRLVLETYSARVFEVGQAYDGYAARAEHPLFDPERFDAIPAREELEAFYRAAHTAQALYMAGLQAQERGDLPAAAASFGNALLLHPDFEDANLLFGGCCLALGDAARARPALERAAAIDPADPRPRELLSRIPRGG